MTKLLYRVDEAAYVLAISRRQVYYLIEAGELIAHNDSPGRKGLRIVVASVGAYAEKYIQAER